MDNKRRNSPNRELAFSIMSQRISTNKNYNGLTNYGLTNYDISALRQTNKYFNTIFSSMTKFPFYRDLIQNSKDIILQTNDKIVVTWNYDNRVRYVMLVDYSLKNDRKLGQKYLDITSIRIVSMYPLNKIRPIDLVQHSSLEEDGNVPESTYDIDQIYRQNYSDPSKDIFLNFYFKQWFIEYLKTQFFAELKQKHPTLGYINWDFSEEDTELDPEIENDRASKTYIYSIEFLRKRTFNLQLLPIYLNVPIPGSIDCLPCIFDGYEMYQGPCPIERVNGNGKKKVVILKFTAIPISMNMNTYMIYRFVTSLSFLNFSYLVFRPYDEMIHIFSSKSLSYNKIRNIFKNNPRYFRFNEDGFDEQIFAEHMMYLQHNN